jgi:hypothetical protein
MLVNAKSELHKLKGWFECDANDPDALLENLNRLYFDAVWNPHAGRFVLRGQ